MSEDEFVASLVRELEETIEREGAENDRGDDRRAGAGRRRRRRAAARATGRPSPRC